MADTVKISELPVATSTAIGDIVPIVQGGVTKQLGTHLMALPAVSDESLIAYYSMDSIPEIPDNVGGTTYIQDTWASADGWGTGDTITFPAPGIIRITGSSGAGYILLGRTFTYTAAKNVRIRVRTSKGTFSAYWRQSIGGTDYDTYLPPITGYPEDFELIGIAETQTGTMTAAYLIFPGFGNGDWVEFNLVYVGTEACDTLLADDSGNNKSGRMTALLPVGGVSGRGAAFNGINSKIDISSNLVLSGAGTVSFCLLVPSGTVSNLMILARNDSATGYIYDAYGSYTKLEFTDTTAIIIPPGNILRDGISHFYSISFGVSGYRLIRDSAIVSTDGSDYSTKQFIASRIGAYIDGSSPLLGVLDEVQMDDRVLSVDETYSLYINKCRTKALPDANNARTVSGFGIGTINKGLVTDYDINGIYEGGNYSVNNTAKGNFPQASGYWTIVHTQYADLNYGTQVAYTVGSGGLPAYIRHRQVGVWSVWDTIWTPASDGNGGQPPAPKPTNAGTIGQWTIVNAGDNTALFAPAGGTWSTILMVRTTATQSNYGQMYGSVVAGGAQLYAASLGNSSSALCWRIA